MQEAVSAFDVRRNQRTHKEQVPVGSRQGRTAISRKTQEIVFSDADGAGRAKGQSLVQFVA